jgi:hypothetical protein
MPDFLPHKDKDLLLWSENFLHAVSERTKMWSIPEDEVNALELAHQSYETHLKVADSPSKNTFIVADKNHAREKLVSLIRAMVRFRLQNPIITDSDLLWLGLHPHDTTRTKSPIAEEHPDAEIDSSELRRLSVHFFAKGSKRGSHAKPKGQHGVEIRWAILDKAPESIEAELIHSSFDTYSPFILSFDENLRGKSVYLVLRWENNLGEKGPWGQIIRAMIP